MNPTISVITTVYNGEKTIRNTIESVLLNRPLGVEYIIVDAASSDGSLRIISDYLSELDGFISEPDRGIYDGWNKGLHLAKGEYISFIGADDTFTQNALTDYMTFIKKEPKAQYVCSLARMNDARSRVIGRPFRWGDFRRHMRIAHVGSLHHNSLFKKYGMFDTRFRIAGDYDFLLRTAGDITAGFMDSITVNMGTGGLSNKSGLLALREARRAKIHNEATSRFVANLDYVTAATKYVTRTKLLARFNGA